MTKNDNYSVNGRHLCWPDGQAILFDSDIEKVVPVADVLVVLLALPSQPGMNENIFGVRDRKIIWRVEPRQGLHEYWPYSGLRVDGHDVTLCGVDGVDAYIDFRTGKIIGSELTK